MVLVCLVGVLLDTGPSRAGQARTGPRCLERRSALAGSLPRVILVLAAAHAARLRSLTGPVPLDRRFGAMIKRLALASPDVLDVVTIAPVL